RSTRSIATTTRASSRSRCRRTRPRASAAPAHSRRPGGGPRLREERDPREGAVMPPTVPFALPSEVSPFAGKSLQGTVIRALWGQQRARRPFHNREKYCDNGDTAFACRQNVTPALTDCALGRADV